MKTKYNKEIRIASVILSIGFIITILAPSILSIKSTYFTFDENTASIGDTIGGITSPITNILGSILIFLALKAQLKANEIIQTQIEDQKLKENQKENSTQLHRLYNTLESNVKNYSFKGFNEEDCDKVHKGSDGIHKFFSTIRCNFHQDEESLLETTCVTELLSILQICSMILKKLENSYLEDKELLHTLTKHQFDYRIMPALRNLNDTDLTPYYCEECYCTHGIPHVLLTEIKEIQRLLKSETVT